MFENRCIQAIIGLGNPGPSYVYTRHNIGFRVLDALAQNHNASFSKKENFELATISGADRSILLIKPLTSMNLSGKVIPYILKQGIKSENIVVVHDELEKNFGAILERLGGSARGHNGLKSIIDACGLDFARLRIGIGRPQEREQVPAYVLQKFNEPAQEVDRIIALAVDQLNLVIARPCKTL